MSEKKYYCFCSSNCKYETMTKEQILAAIAQATGNSNVDPDAGFITKVKEKNGGNYITFWVGSQAQYNAIATKDVNCMYIISDDMTTSDFKQYVDEAVKTVTTARADTETAAAQAIAAAAGIEPVDISSKIGLVVKSGNNTLTEMKFLERVYIYIPKLKIVFYSFVLNLKGSMQKNRTLQIQHNGGYLPKGYAYIEYPATASHRHFTASYTMGGHLLLRATEDFDTGDMAVAFTFSGWYFCDGEE